MRIHRLLLTSQTKRRASKAAAMVVLLAGPVLPALQAGTVQEYEVKAAFLYNFAKFVEWPPEAFASSRSPVIIGLLGRDPFGELLDQKLAGKTAGGRPFLVKRYARVADAEGAHILFVSRSEKAAVSTILQAANGWPALTVSEVPGFASKGGVINFYLDGGQVRFEINPEAAKRSGLKLNAQLLSVARIVK